jgi:hypothetical protein
VSPVAPGVFGGPYAFTVGRSFWQDVLRIDSPDRTGQTGWVTVAFTIDGSINGSGGTQVEDIHYRFLWGAANTVYDPFSGELVRGPGILNNQRLHTFPFRFGEPFAMSITIEARVGSVLDQPGQAEVDLAHTQTWGGFQSVTDGAGVALPFTTTSTSGADFSQPITAIPEPGVAGLFVASCAAWRYAGAAGAKDRFGLAPR